MKISEETKYTFGFWAILLGWLAFLVFAAFPQNHRFHYEHAQAATEAAK